MGTSCVWTGIQWKRKWVSENCMTTSESFILKYIVCQHKARTHNYYDEIQAQLMNVTQGFAVSTF